MIVSFATRSVTRYNRQAMAVAAPSEVFRCPQCGGELHPDEGQIFLTCPYCGSAVHADKSRIVFHWYLAATLDEAKARGALARWMAGQRTSESPRLPPR